MQIAVLGLGIMGGAMARRLVDAGHGVRVYNRSADKAAPLGDAGAVVAATPGQAVAGADAFLTVLSDADAVEAVVTGDGGALDAAGPETLWIQISTVGDEIDRLRALAAEHGVGFVDAPVLGTKAPAEAGELTVLAAATADVRDRCAPIFDVIGSKTVWLDAPGQASRFKLVVNTWVLGLLGTLAEAVALAERFDVDPRRLLATIAGGPLDVGYAHSKGAMMLEGEYPTSFPLSLALKDARLIAGAAEERGLELRVVKGVAAWLAAAAEAHGEEDMAALVEPLRDR